ncbi:phosphomannose isomerase type II C-terminal cupin domain [Fastidiosibacter lacustris]|uniref:phosphomannose isomerase type II C-terminal cupin domain n=1 Tax=Fastidiosibacter lacustris TaxID=2056695 RepID=UPI000E34552F|nr:phosphomannose isomerase type II C-terminal cupin domain [Fastidiosibacter lacustris]
MSINLNKTGQTYYRPWGSYKTIEQGNGFQAKLITVNPGGCLSLQKHSKRAEHWIVIQGTATITIDNSTKDYQVNTHVYIPTQAVHRLHNKTDETIAIIEVQIGSYLGEDDIIRLDDIYNRN